MELFTDKGGGHVGRRLMTVGSEGVEGRGVSEEDLALVEWVANDKRKELTREQDLRRWAGLIPETHSGMGFLFLYLFMIGLLKSGRKNLGIG